MARLNLADAIRIARTGRPWALRMECVDPATNTNKFWFATGRGLHEAVETGHGRIGAKPALRLTSFGVFVSKASEKLIKGYVFAHTPFVRMSAGNMAKLGGRKPSKGITAPDPVITAPAPTPAAAVKPVAASSGAFVYPPMGTPMPGLPALDGPYTLIVALFPVKGGFEALDEDGDVVLDLTTKGGQDLCQGYGIPMVWSR